MNAFRPTSYSVPHFKVQLCVRVFALIKHNGGVDENDGDDDFMLLMLMMRITMLTDCTEYTFMQLGTISAYLQ